MHPFPGLRIYNFSPSLLLVQVAGSKLLLSTSLALTIFRPNKMKQILILTLLIATQCHARQHYRGLLPNGLFVPCPPEDPECDAGGVCEGIGHESCGGGVVTPKLNAFGQDFLAAGIKWTQELCEKDSDGDGFSNGYELGDPCCIWKEGANMPKWMKEWEISHPGFKESTQTAARNTEQLCHSVKPLEVDSLYNEGEDRVVWDFLIKEHTVPAADTTYIDFRFNFPENGTFYLVGAEAIVDNSEMVHHYVVTTCGKRVDESKQAIPFDDEEDTADDGTENCLRTIWGWAPGGRLEVPKDIVLPLGEAHGSTGIRVEVHYDNPLLKEGRTDASALRFHLTTKPRKNEGALLYTGGVTTVGIIRPKKRVYSATIYQAKVDRKIAPYGVKVFGFFPHMHALGKKLWVEKLQRKKGQRGGMLTDLTQLEKVRDIGRDDTWSIDLQFTRDVPRLTIKDGDYLATTCIYDSEGQDAPVLGGPSSQEEMCIGFLSYYPGAAMDDVLYHSGTYFVNEVDDETYGNMNSIMDIIAHPNTKTRLPKWREAYLKGDLACQPKERVFPIGVLGITLGDKDFEDAATICGERTASAVFNYADVLKKPECTLECARFLYDILGCSLLEKGVDGKGKPLELFSSPLEAHVEDWCGHRFNKIYSQDRVTQSRRNPRP